MSLLTRLAARLHSLWLYVLLAGGSLIFMWPFLWMATASVKLDREHFAEDATLLPARPIPRAASPYLETRSLDRYTHPRLEAVRPALEAALRPHPLHWPQGIEPDDARTVLATGLFRRIARLAPESWWTRPDEELARDFTGLLTPAMIESERAALLRGFVFGRVLVRSYDLEEEVAIAADEIPEAWTIGGTGHARFELAPDTASLGRILAYDFAGGDVLTLSTTLNVGFSLERLHRIQFFFRPDDTWHALDCFVEMNGRRYRAERVTTLFDQTWRSVNWQLPGPDDQTNQQKTWLLLNDLGADPGHEAAPGRIKLTLELKRRGMPGAWLAKISRNYHTVLEHIPFGRYVATSLYLVILQVLGTLFSCSLVAYSFARLRWPGRSACFLIMLGTMMLPSQVTMIPYFLIIRDLGWYNTLYPLWVPSLFANAFYVFLLYQFMRGIPRDLEDAARIDGCGVLRIYWHVMLPLVRPSLAAIAIFTFMGVWNDFMGPLIYLQDQRLYPLSLGLYALDVQNSQGSNSMGLMMAGSLLMTLPVIVIFFFAQRYFIQGITMTGMKG